MALCINKVSYRIVSYRITIHLIVIMEVYGKPITGLGPMSSSVVFLLTVPGRCFFYGSFVLFLSCFVMLSCTSVC